jgi:hypothetical protein
MVSGIPIGSKGERNLSDMQPELNPITEKKMLRQKKSEFRHHLCYRVEPERWMLI